MVWTGLSELATFGPIARGNGVEFYPGINLFSELVLNHLGGSHVSSSIGKRTSSAFVACDKVPLFGG